MRAWLLILTMLSTLLIGPSTAKAAGTFSISQSFPASGATGVPVDLGNDNYHPNNFGYATHAINLALSGLTGGCSLNRSTFNQQTVQISSSKDSYTLGTVTANLTSSTPWIALGSAVAGFELSPFTAYTLTLRGGTNGVSMNCNGQTLFLGNDWSQTLTTGADTVPPQILGPQTSATNSAATISWETFQSASGQVAFGIGNLDQTASQAGNSTLHNVTLQNLRAGTAYNFQIRSTDAAGNTGTSNGTFTTLGLGDVVVNEVQDMSATVQWTSNQATDTIIELGADEKYGDKQGNGGQITNHTLKLVGLKPDTTYHFRIVATNSNGTSIFGDNLFTTKTLLVGAQQGSVDGISTSDDNIKMFPQVDFQPMVLGASSAATALSNGFTIGKNLLAGRAIPVNSSTGRVLLIFVWLVPILLIAAIAFIVWRLRQHKVTLQPASSPS